MIVLAAVAESQRVGEARLVAASNRDVAALADWLIGTNREWQTISEVVEHDPWLDLLADEIATFSVSSTEGASFASPMISLLLPFGIACKSALLGAPVEQGIRSLVHAQPAGNLCPS